MYFFKVDMSCYEDAARTIYIVPDQKADEQGVPFEEKMLTQTAKYKAFVKETKATLIDCTYTEYKTDALVTNDLTDEQFSILAAEGQLQQIESNTFTVTAGKSKGGGDSKNKMMYLVIGGIALVVVIIILISALKGSNNSGGEVSETQETSSSTTVSTETSETSSTSTETSSTPSSTTESSDTSSDTSDSGAVDVPSDDTTTEPPSSETNDSGYTNGGYGSNASSGTSGVYTISFSTNGGEGKLDSISSEAGQYVVLPNAKEASKKISKKGYKLIGFSDNTEIPYPLYDYKMPYENVTLFAVWEADTFIVTYNSNGGTGTVSRAEVKYGAQVPLPKDASIYKDGLFLTGWAKDANAKAPLKSLAMPAENITLYAFWDKKPPTAKIALHYDDKVQIVEAEIGSTLDMLDDFGVSKDGFVVSGWYLENNPNRIESLEVTEDCELYAKWQTAEYITITVDQSYLKKDAAQYKVALDMTGKAKLILPVVDNKNDIYNSVFGCTYGYSTKKQDGEFGTIEYYGGVENEFTKSVTLYRVLNEYGGGKGTKQNPYIISYYDQLLRLSEQKARGYFIQTADIKFPKNTERKPIDTMKIARGYETKSCDYFVYDGQGFSIRNLSDSGGLFGTVAASTIKNIVIEGAEISSGSYKNVGILCNEVTTYAFPSTENSGYFSTGNTVIQNCTVKNSKIRADKAENIGGICGYGGNITDCFVNFLTISGGENAGGIVGNACNVTGCLVNSFTADRVERSAGGIAGTAYGIKLYEDKDSSRNVGGNIIGCGVRTFTATAENSGGIIGTSTSDASAYVKSCYAANIYLNGKNNGGIAGADGTKNKHRIAYCIVDNTNKYPVIGGENVRSTAKTMVLSVPADTGLTVEGVLSVLNADGSGYSYWERENNVNGGYPYPKMIAVKGK